MSSFYVEVQVQAAGVTPDEFDTNFDLIADALYECSGVEDTDLTSDASTLVYTFAMSVDVPEGLNEIEGPILALRTSLDVARTALHTAGGHTAGWTVNYHTLRNLVEAQVSATAATAA